MKKNLYKILFSITFILVASFGIFTVFHHSNIVKAQSVTANLSGYAWSSNIGWISFATSTQNVNGVQIYSSGTTTGYAWSSNIGWIKFGGLSGFPVVSGSGTTAADAHYDASTGLMTGWARACAGTANGDCSLMTSRTGGWDGWISLSGKAVDNSNYGVKLDGSHSYAWGSDVVGWIDFNKVTVNNLCANPTYSCNSDNTGEINSCTGATTLCQTGYACFPASGRCAFKSSMSVNTFTISPNTVNAYSATTTTGGNCNLSWTLTSPDASTSCAIYRGTSASVFYPTYPTIINNNSSTTDSRVQNETTYKFVCGEMATNNPAILISSSTPKYATCYINPISKEVN